MTIAQEAKERLLYDGYTKEEWYQKMESILFRIHKATEPWTLNIKKL